MDKTELQVACEESKACVAVDGYNQYGNMEAVLVEFTDKLAEIVDLLTKSQNPEPPKPKLDDSHL